MLEQILKEIATTEKFLIDISPSTAHLLITEKTKKEEEILFLDGSKVNQMTNVEVVTPIIDYDYLKSKFNQNPFNLIENLPDIYLTYIYCLTKDARAALWENNIELVQKILIRIQKIKNIFAIMQENTHHIISPTQFDQPLSIAQFCFYFPLGNKIMLSRFFTSQTETNDFLSRKIPTQLQEAHREIFYNFIEECHQQGQLWKSGNALILDIEKVFHSHLATLIKTNQSHFIKGRKTFIQLYTTIQKRLKKELRENRSLTPEQRSHAKHWIEKIGQLILEQQDYLKKDFIFLIKRSYSNRTLTEWLNQNETLKEQVIQAPKKSS